MQWKTAGRRLRITTCCVGNSLRRVETAMHRLELSFLGKLPSCQRPLIPEVQPVVLEIAFGESASAEREEQLEKS